MKSKAMNKMVLGTAQLGSLYGVANHSGCPSVDQAMEILKAAYEAGIKRFDTASSYGMAERLLGLTFSEKGDRFQITTKLKKLPNEASQWQESEISLWVIKEVKNSIDRLQIPSIDNLLLHSFDDVCVYEKFNFRPLINLLKTDLVTNLGVSVYSPSEAFKITLIRHFNIVQIPFNILDRRWTKLWDSLDEPTVGNLKIQVRSVFLQGLLVSGDQVWPLTKRRKSLIFEALRCACKSFGFDSHQTLLFSYALSKHWINEVIFGCETIEQLNKNLIDIRSVKLLSNEELLELEEMIPAGKTDEIDPRTWG